MPESSYDSISNTTYTLSVSRTSSMFDAYVYLTNSPPLKAGDSISFKFTGDFEIGKTYMVCADEPLFYSSWPTTADTAEIIDEAANPSNNYFVFTVPPDPATIPICFPKGTPVLTNLGPVAIEKLNTDKHTIRGKDIIAITQSKPLQKHIVCFEKDALSKNVPSQQTLCSMEHKIFYQGEMTKARNLVDLCENVTFVPYNGETLFNVLLKKHDKMMINNLICETLHPENIAAKISTMKDGQKKNQAIQELTKIIKENNVPEYQKLYASL